MVRQDLNSVPAGEECQPVCGVRHRPLTSDSSLGPLSLQSHPEHVGDQDRCGPSQSLDPFVPGEEAALSASQTAAVPTNLNQVSVICPAQHSLRSTVTAYLKR